VLCCWVFQELEKREKAAGKRAVEAERQLQYEREKVRAHASEAMLQNEKETALASQKKKRGRAQPSANKETSPPKPASPTTTYPAQEVALPPSHAAQTPIPQNTQPPDQPPNQSATMDSTMVPTPASVTTQATESVPAKALTPAVSPPLPMSNRISTVLTIQMDTSQSRGIESTSNTTTGVENKSSASTPPGRSLTSPTSTAARSVAGNLLTHTEELSEDNAEAVADVQEALRELELANIPKIIVRLHKIAGPFEHGLETTKGGKRKVEAMDQKRRGDTEGNKRKQTSNSKKVRMIFDLLH
jgi:hypothetical protein